MIVLDTHIWVWWIHGESLLPPGYAQLLADHEEDGLGVSTISCWEVAKLAEYSRLDLPCDVLDWLDQALGYPGIILLDLTPRIVVDSTQLPGSFHHDPADQLIVATARAHACPLITADRRILEYPHVQTPPRGQEEPGSSRME